jgi:hypothetical protein
MRAIEPHILALEQAAARSDTGALPAAAKQLRGAVEAAGGPARAAGVRRCGDRTQAIALADGVLAPVFAQGFADFQRSFLRRLGRERARHSADSPADVSGYFTRVSDLLAKARTDFEGLEAPARAEGLDSLYGAALTAMSGFAARRPASSRAVARSTRRRS